MEWNARENQILKIDLTTWERLEDYLPDSCCGTIPDCKACKAECGILIENCVD